MRSASPPDTRGVRWGRWAFALIALLTPVAWLLRFVQDDAYISFVYAQRLASGEGLTWPGVGAVEGYTNFLWTVMLAVPHALGASPVTFAYASGMILFPLALCGAWRVGRAVFDDPIVALVGVLLAGTNASFLRYATGGLETMLQTALVVWVYALCAHAWNAGRLSARRAIAISIVVLLAGMTRMDSAVLLLPAGAMCALLARRDWRVWLCLLGPVGAGMIGWLAWKSNFYGAILPNTFAAKAGTSWTPVRGVWFLACFALSYGWFLLALGVFWPRAWRAVRRRSLFALALGAPVVLWSAYIVYAGGDFMEFRFIVPVLPLLALLVAAPFAAMPTLARTAFVAIALLFSVQHALLFERSPLKRGIESIEELERNLYEHDDGWIVLGERLREDLGRSSTVIALTPAGAITYHSGLPVIDMIGLNDPVIAREGVYLSDRAGHRKIATLGQLVERGVDLIIGHPQVFDPSELVDGRYPRAMLDPLFLTRGVPDIESLPDGARIVTFASTFDPDGPRVLALQLRPQGRIDELVSSGVWGGYDIGPAAEAGPMGE